jgi:hypothetical protein
MDLTARAIVLQAFLFDLSKIGAAKKFTVQQQMNRARGARVIRRSKGTEHCDYVVMRVRIYRIMRAAQIKQYKLCSSAKLTSFSSPAARKRRGSL